MAATYLHAASYSVVDPVVISGWTRFPSTDRLRVVSAGSPAQNNFYQSAFDAFSNACVYRDAPILTPVVRAGWLMPNANASVNDQKGVGVINADGNGYALIQTPNQPGTLEIRLMIAGILQATPIASYTLAAGVLNDEFYFDWTRATGEIKAYQVADAVGAATLRITHTNATYTDCNHVCIVSKGSAAYVVSAFWEGIGGTVTALTDPIRPGSPLTATTTGFSTITGITAAGMSATGISFLGGAVSANWPALTEGQVLPVALPASATVFTFTDGANTATRTSTLNAPSGYAAVEMGVIITDPDWLGAAVTINPGNRIYYPSNHPGVGNITIYPDGNIATDTAGTFPAILHRFGGDNVLQFLNITRTATGVTETSFASVDFAAMSAYIESNAITVAEEGENPISIEGLAAEYAIDSGEGYSAWTSVAGTVAQDDQVKVRIFSPRRPGQAASCTITIGAFQSTFTLTTSASADTGASIMIVNSNNPIEAGEPFTITFDELNAADVMLVVLEEGDQTYYPTIDTVDSATQLTATAPVDLPADALVTVRVYESKHARAIRDMA